MEEVFCAISKNVCLFLFRKKLGNKLLMAMPKGIFMSENKSARFRIMLEKLKSMKLFCRMKGVLSGTGKKRSIKNSLFYFFILIFLVFIVLYYVSSTINTNRSIKQEGKSYETTLKSSKETTLRNVTQLTLKILNNQYNNYLKEWKELPKEGSSRPDAEKRVEGEYQKDFQNLLRTLGSEVLSFYLLDSSGLMIINTDDFSLENSNQLTLADIDGYEYIKDLVQLAHKGGGFANTCEKKGKKDINKMYYGVFFEKWDWILLTSTTTTDIYEKIETIKASAHQRLFGQLLIFFIVTLMFLIVGIYFINRITNKVFVFPIKNLIKKTNEISSGDLTVKFDYANNDEFGDMINAFVKMVDTLKHLNQKIYVAVTILNKNLRTLYQSSNNVKNTANLQAVTVEETQKDFRALNGMIEKIVSESYKADGYAVQALEKAKVGMESMEKLEREMGKIESSSMEIADIINLINDIAEQTNLLALNASIESARAGEAGRGFNIVASEIRKLAEKSTSAANNIHRLISNNNTLISEGVKYTKETTDALKEISVSNELISGLVKTVTEEVINVTQGSEKILAAMVNISETSQDNLSDSENVNLTLHDFVEQTIELQKFVGQFDVRSERAKENQSHIEDLLKAKLEEAESILKEFGGILLPTGNLVKINTFKINELQLGEIPITNNTTIVDEISKKIRASVTFFQPADDCLVRVATTVRNFDDTRAIGTFLTKESPIYRKVVEEGNVYFGRAFVVNRWYVAVYHPIKDETGFVTGVLYIGIPEEGTLEEE